MAPRSAPRRSRSALLPCLLLVAGTVAAQAADPPAPAPARERARPLPDAPAAPDRLPDGLLPRAPRPTPTPEAPRAAVPRQGRAVQPAPVVDDRILTWARDSGRWAATALFEARGRLEVLRVAFHHGLRTAADDPRIGDRDEQDGLRDGRLDRRADDAGFALAADEAARIAEADARSRAETLFADLSVEPGYEPPPPSPRWRAPVAPASPPSLEDIVRSWPPDALPRELSAAVELMRGRDTDPWELFRRPAPVGIDAWWSDPDQAFQLWIRYDEHERRYRALPNDVARRGFRDAFDAGMAEALEDDVTDLTRAAWNDGFGTGWRYGAWMVSEWRYAVGWHDGWTEAVAAAAEAAFPSEWDRAWERAFAAELGRWWRSPQPRLRDLRLADEGDDGVFEPGETVLATVEVANLGGAPATSELTLAGDALVGPRSVALELPARTARTVLVELGIRPDAPLRHRSVVTTSVGGVVDDHPLWVSRPLEIEHGWRAVRVDPVAGTATVAATIANASRRPVYATAALEIDGAPALDGFVDLGELAAGAAAEARFELAGIHGIDLLAGTIHGALVVRGDGAEHDRRRGRLPDLAGDLARHDLERYLEAASRRADVAHDDVALLASLVRRRLEIDWRAAVEARGNPYRDDAEARGRTTALGDLVRLAARAAPGAASPELLHAVGSEARALADELPGAHPNLRRWYRTLARRLP